MQREVISTCPVCESQLHVTRLHCNTCGTTIEGEFTVGRFAHLGRDQMLLLEGFLRSRGNLRELERELNVSYPTIRGRVEQLLRALGLGDGAPLPPTPPTPPAEPRSPQETGFGVDAATRRSVLERLSRKEITADEAAALLRGEQPAAEKTDDSAKNKKDTVDEETTVVENE
jgi:hypothetical protein